MKKTSLLLSLLASLLVSPAQAAPNPSFEQGATGWTLFAPAEAKTQNCRFSISQDSPHSGQACALLQSDGFARFALGFPGFGVQPGDHYRVTAWVRAGADFQLQPGEDVAGAIVRLTLIKDKKDAAGSHLYVRLNGAVTHGGVTGRDAAVPTEWTQIQAVVQVPDDADTMGPSLFVWNAKGSLYVDDFSVEKVDATTALSPVTVTTAHGPEGKTQGPKLVSATDADLLAELDTTSPGMDKVKAAIATGNLPQIQAAYLDYRRTASTVKWQVMPSDKPATATEKSDARSDEIANHHLRNNYGFKPSEVDMGKDFNWSFNPVPKTDPAYTDEWTFGPVSRTQFWKVLVDGYWKTLDEKYAQTWVDQMEDFVKKNPLPESAGHASLWRTLDASERMDDSWPYCYNHVLNSSAFTPEAEWIYAKSIIDHGHLLANGLKDPNRTGNWVASECFGLYSIGVLFPEFKDAAAWRQTALDRLASEAARMVPPDGMEAELTPGYHSFSLSSFLGPVELAKLNNLQVPALLSDKVISMYRALVLVMDQSGNDVPTNDSGVVNAASMAAQGLRVADDPLLAWAASHGKKGTAPPNSTMLPYAGFYAMRSGWDHNDLFCFFRAGPTGIGHEHEDMLEIALNAEGENLLFDPGTYPYDHSDWRRFTCGTASHSTIIVDGKWQHRGASKLPALELHNPWALTPIFNYAAGTYDGGYQQSVLTSKEFAPWSWVGEPDKSVTHTRRILFLPPYGVLVLDTVDGTGQHTIDSHFQLNAPSARIDPATQAAFTTKAAGEQLALIPLERDHLQAEVVQGQNDPLLGWKPHEHQPIPTIRFRKVQEAPAIFATLLLPFSGQAAPVVASQPLAITGGAVWGQALVMPNEKMETAIVKSSTAEALAFTSALAGNVRALAAGIVLRQPVGKPDIYGGGWSLQSYSDDKIAFTLDVPASVAFSAHAGGLLVFNGNDGDIRLTVTKPFSQTVTLPANAWTQVNASGTAPATDPKPFPPMARARSASPLYADYLKSQPATHPAASAASPIVIDAATMKIPAGVQLVEKTGAQGNVISIWDEPGEVISKEITVPAAGWYQVRLRYCSAATPERSLLINGKVPFSEAEVFSLDSTIGEPPSTGWSTLTSDWREIVLGQNLPATPQGWKIYLPAGPVTIGLRNDGGGGCNVNWLTLEPAKA